MSLESNRSGNVAGETPEAMSEMEKLLAQQNPQAINNNDLVGILKASLDTKKDSNGKPYYTNNQTNSYLKDFKIALEKTNLENLLKERFTQNLVTLLENNPKEFENTLNNFCKQPQADLSPPTLPYTAPHIDDSALYMCYLVTYSNFLADKVTDLANDIGEFCGFDKQTMALLNTGVNAVKNSAFFIIKFFTDKNFNEFVNKLNEQGLTETAKYLKESKNYFEKSMAGQSVPRPTMSAATRKELDDYFKKHDVNSLDFETVFDHPSAESSQGVGI